MRLTANHRVDISLAASTCAILAFSLFGSTSAPAQSADATYEIPAMNGVPVDGCASWQANCGQGGADAFCRTQGYAGARQWSWAYDLRTWNIGSNRYCDRAADNIRCGGLRTVTCTGSLQQARPQPLPQQQQQGPLAGYYNGGGWGNVTITGGPQTYQGTFDGGTFQFPSDGNLGRWMSGGGAGNLRVTPLPNGSLNVGFNSDDGGANGSMVWTRR